MYIVGWRRTTSTGGKEWNYYYCDTLAEAEEFIAECKRLGVFVEDAYFTEGQYV